MGLLKNITTDSGINVNNAYVRIEGISGTKESISLSVCAYVSKEACSEGKEYIQMSVHTFEPSTSTGSENFIKQGYEYLKTLPEFAESLDV